jgi:3-oxoacyl-[acyl-carrier protein] reductase
MDLGLKDRVAMITGASRGLGKASALALAAEGCHISTIARGAEDLETAKRNIEALGVQTLTLQGDAGRAQDAEQFFNQTLETFGRVDILINNIGGSSPGGNVDESDETWRLAFENNFFSAVRLIRLTLPEMQRLGWGRVINISSIFGREWGGNATYMSSKAALLAVTKQIARSVTDDRITINSVAPGSIMFEGGSWWKRRQQDPETIDAFIQTEMPYGRMGRPEEIGSVVAFLASEQASLINAACLNVDGGQSRSLI